MTWRRRKKQTVMEQVRGMLRAYHRRWERNRRGRW